MKNKHAFYINIAKHTATASYCNKLKVGAILVKNNNIISFGYNGTPYGFDNCCEINNITLPEVIHAEVNALIKCAKIGISTDNSEMYITHSPCINCAKLIIQAGVKKIYYNILHKNDGLNILQKANIEINQINL